MSNTAVMEGKPGYVQPEFPVRVQNNSSREVVLKWDGVRYRIPANGMNVVPFDAMVRVVGNPNVIGPERQEEYARLKVLHNLGTIDNPSLEADYPLSFYTIDGDPIVTVLDDPEGEHLTPVTQTSVDQTFLLNTIDKLTRQVQALQAQADANVRADISEQMGIDVGTDQPAKGHPGAPDQPRVTSGVIPGVDGNVTYADTSQAATDALLDHPPAIPDATHVEDPAAIPDAGKDVPKTVRVGAKAQAKKGE